MSRLLLCAVWLALPAAAPAQGPATPEAQARRLVAEGQAALDGGATAVAAWRFQRALTKSGATGQASAARYGLAQCVTKTPEPDFAKALELVKPAAQDGNFPQRPAALALLGLTHRQLGLAHKNAQAAQRHFEEALQAFASASQLYEGAKQPDASARARCDRAEMELRLKRYREARGTCEPFLKDEAYAKSPHKKLGLYTHGVACFLDRDLAGAGRSLNLASPFDGASFGLHAEYLLGRLAHLGGEGAEAAVHYRAVLRDYEAAREEAAARLSRPERLRAEPLEKARLTALLAGAPEPVVGATFHTAALEAEAGRYAPGLARFEQLLKDSPASPLAPDARLRVGFCQVQLGQFDDAVKTLTPLTDKPARLGDQVLFQLGKAQLGLATATPGVEREPARRRAIETLRRATERAGQLAGQEPEARARRWEMLFELADAQHAARQFSEAAQLYESLWNEQALPQRREELLQRVAVAAGNAGQHDRSQQRADEFLRAFPQSRLAGGVLLRLAETHFARALEAQRDKNRAAESRAKFEEAATKYRAAAQRDPEEGVARLALFGLGVCQAQLGQADAAAQSFAAIPPDERVGPLAATGLLLADSLVAQLPRDPTQSKPARERLAVALSLVERFVADNPDDPEVPAASIRRGGLLRRIAALTPEVEGRDRTFRRAAEAFTGPGSDDPRQPLAGRARVERAAVRVALGERAEAAKDLAAFQSEPWQSNRFAPLAWSQLARMSRERKDPRQALKLLDEALQRYDGALSGDPERVEWAWRLQFQRGDVLQEVGRLADARKAFEEVYQKAKGRPLSAEAALRVERTRAEEGRKTVEVGQEALRQAGGDNGRRNAAQQTIDRGRALFAEAANQLTRRSEESRDRLPNSEARARMYYEAAWAWRAYSEADVKRATDDYRRNRQRKWADSALTLTPPETTPPAPPPWRVEPGEVPLESSQNQAFQCYRRLIGEFGETRLGLEARDELGALLAQRGDHEAVTKLLADVCEREFTDPGVPPELPDRLRLRLGASLMARGEFAAAATCTKAAARNPKSRYRTETLARAGEAELEAREPAKAVETLKPFRDRVPDDIAGRRGQLALGLAHLALKQYDPARQAFAAVSRDTPADPLAGAAQYATAWSLQQQGRTSEALAAYQLALVAPGHVAAKAQLQIGQCHLAQRRPAEAAAAFLLVPALDGAPTDLDRAGLLEAARALAMSNQPVAAAQLLRKLADDPDCANPWAEAARERLAQSHP